MKMAFFAVPALDPGDAGQDLNRFLGAHRVLAVDRQLVSPAQGAYWAICVSYHDGQDGGAPIKRGKIDYKEVRSETDFAVFARLRVLRKEIAQREGVPAYALFTNEQLAAMVTQRVRTPEELGALSGVGPSKVEKYGQARRRWETAYALGLIDARTLQQGYASASAVTAHADAAGWRRSELSRRPAPDA